MVLCYTGGGVITGRILDALIFVKDKVLQMLNNNAFDMLVIGAGIFGITTALELKARGYHVAVLDPGPLPHPLAASTDISKVVRMEYGADETYMEMIEQAYQGWLRWNEELGETLFHDVGVLILTSTPMIPGMHEYESYRLLLKRGHTPVRLTGEAIPSGSLPGKRGSTSMASFMRREVTRKVAEWSLLLSGSHRQKGSCCTRIKWSKP